MGSLGLRVGLCLLLMLSGYLQFLGVHPSHNIPSAAAAWAGAPAEAGGPRSAGAPWLQASGSGAVLSEGVMQGPLLTLGDRPPEELD